MFRRILVPVDRSRFAEHALPYAVASAKPSGATLHVVLVHTGMHARGARAAPVAFETGFDDMILREEREYLEALEHSLAADHGLTVASNLLEGPVSRSISRYVRQTGIDLVIMSTHGHGGLRRAWIGSVADRLLRRLRVPVLLIRPYDSTVAPPAFEHFRAVVAALDGSAAAEAGLASAQDLPLADDAGCTLLRIAIAPMLPMSPYIPDAARLNREEIEQKTGEAESYLEDVAKRATAWPRLERRVVAAYRPAEALLDHAGELRADLIVLGTHGRGPVSRAVIGSVADKVIRGAAVPVLVFPAAALPRTPAAAAGVEATAVR